MYLTKLDNFPFTDWSYISSDIVRLVGNAEYETLIYPRGICLQLAELLQSSTSIYPKSHQKLGEWDVGWLERDIGRHR